MTVSGRCLCGAITYELTGDPIATAICHCELVQPAGILAVKAGTLDDRSAVAPTVEAWCDHKQPWVQIPGLATSLARE